jgi:exonuclease III
MAKFLQLALWNASGLTQHTEELQTFISLHNTDVMLISETRFTEKSYLEFPKYTMYHMNKPARTARGGTAIIINNSIKHHQLNDYSQDFLQATSV